MHTARLGKHCDADMTQGPISRQLLEFAIPMMLGLLFQQLYNTVDTIVVGRFVGKEALAAVGSTGSIINILIGACAGLATGASVVISQCYGAHENESLHDAVHTTIAVTFILCALVTALGVGIVSPMLRLMATPSDVFFQAKQYLTIYFAGSAGLLIYNMGSGILRAVGDSRRPLYFLIVSALLNIGLDLLFVIVFRWGIAGVAWATILSQLISAVLVLFSLTRGDVSYGITWRHVRIKRDMLSRILKIGLPTTLQQSLTSFSNVFVQSYVNFFGSTAMAGWSSYGKLDMYIMIPMQALVMASTTFVGQNYGAKKLSRARQGVNRSLLLACSITLVCSALMVLFRKTLLTLFTTDVGVIEYGAHFILLITPFYAAMCVNQILAGALRGIGRSREPMYIMLFSFVLFRQIYLFVNKLLGNSLTGVTFAYPVGWVVCSTIMFAFYLGSELVRSKATEPCVANGEQT